MSEYDDLGPLPAPVETEARLCLELLVNHLDPKHKNKKLNKGVETLQFFNTHHAHYSVNNNRIGLEGEGLEYNAIFEENAHFMRSHMKPKSRYHIPEIEEFFGFLGRYIGKELLEKATGKTFTIPSFDAEMSTRVKNLDEAKKEYQKIAQYDNYFSTTTNNYTRLLEAKTAVEKGDYQKAEGLVLSVMKEKKEYLHKIDEVIDKNIMLFKENIIGYLQSLITLNKVIEANKGTFDLFQMYDEHQRAEDALQVFFNNQMIDYKHAESICNVRGDARMTLSTQYTSFNNHARGYLAAEAFVKDNEDFLVKAKDIFYMKDKKISTYFHHPFVIQHEATMNKVMNDSFKLIDFNLKA